MAGNVKLIIDTDPGVDDALALGIALTHPSVEVLALTCVHGNNSVDQCCINALKVLDLFNCKDISVFKGACRPLLGKGVDGTYYHGDDGLADCGHHLPDPDLNKVSETPAALAIIDLAKKHPNEITLVAIGPLTNLALAIHLYPELPGLLKKVVILGGNYQSIGNVTTTGEFNFVSDPEAALIVLNQYNCEIEIIPWELNLDERFMLSFWEELFRVKTKISEFFERVVRLRAAIRKEPHFNAADAWAVVQAIDPTLALETQKVWATVETGGSFTRGMMVVEQRPYPSNLNPNILLIKKADKDKVQKLLISSVSKYEP